MDQAHHCTYPACQELEKQLQLCKYFNNIQILKLKECFEKAFEKSEKV